ncbi:hypothetical protein [Devosia sp.]|uniref:DUF1254 domain-containing protein n=1 Tax=Devosia sp. TaxID=1871048 RepID=UPI003A956505
MIRSLLWLAGGLVLGAIIHIAVILLLPALAPTVAWDRLAELGAADGPVILPIPAPGEDNPLRLDPGLAYAACQIDLAEGPGSVAGPLPQSFWSVVVYNRAGTVVYSTTNRGGIGTRLDVGIFNQAQTRLLAEQKLDIAAGLLIVESPTDAVSVVVRLEPPNPVNRARYERALAGLTCGNLAG